MNDVSRCGHDSSGDEERKTHRYSFRAEDMHGALFPPESFSKNFINIISANTGHQKNVKSSLDLHIQLIMVTLSTEYYYKLVFQSRFLKLFSFPDQILNLQNEWLEYQTLVWYFFFVQLQSRRKKTHNSTIIPSVKKMIIQVKKLCGSILKTPLHGSDQSSGNTA